MCPAPAPAPAHKLALVVEYEAWTRFCLGELLVAAGYAVVHASNGQTGLRMAIQHQPDVILLDLVIPELSGVDVLRELKRSEASCHIPVIVLCASTARLPRGVTGAASVIRKPWTPTGVLRQVQRTAICPG
jgi:CheY-like chemotaxis protein